MKSPIAQVLTDIHQQICRTNTHLDQANQRLDHTVAALGDRLDRLYRRQLEMEVRLAKELVSATGAVREVRDAVIDRPVLEARLDDHEARISKLEQHWRADGNP